MPKRKRENDYEKLLKKFKKLEKKVRRRCRSRSKSSEYPASDFQERECTDSNEACDFAESNIADLLDGTVVPESEYSNNPVAEHAPVSTIRPAIQPVTDTISIPVNDAVAAGPSTSASLNTIICEESPDMILDSSILEILGDDPTVLNNYGTEIHKDLAIRLEHLVTHGLSKELRKELNEKYLLPSNCKLIDAPALNAEIKAAISEMIAKRDKSIELRQKQIARAISGLSQAINKVISSNNADPELIKMLMDSERILCDSQFNDSQIRRNFILSSLKKDMKDQLQNTKPDNLLFGQNLSETIKIAKAINKSGAELKTPTPKPQTSNNKTPAVNNNSKNLNWKGPYPSRKPPNRPKTKEPPPKRNLQSNSSRHSRQQPPRSRR